MNDLSKEEQNTLERLCMGAFLGFELIRHPRATVRCGGELTNSMKCELFRHLMGIGNPLKMFAKRYQVMGLATPNPRATAPFVLGATK